MTSYWRPAHFGDVRRLFGSVRVGIATFVGFSEFIEICKVPITSLDVGLRSLHSCDQKLIVKYIE